MGCSGSTPIQEISKEDSAKGSSDQSQQEKADGIETTENSLQGTNTTEGNQLGPDISLKRSRPKRDCPDQIIDNAWGITNVKKNVKNLERTHLRPRPEEIVDLESEYGKDGVDLASSHVDGDHQDKEKLIKNSVSARTSPDGTYFVDNSERMSKQRTIHKVNIMQIN